MTDDAERPNGCWTCGRETAEDPDAPEPFETTWTREKETDDAIVWECDHCRHVKVIEQEVSDS
ncbi:hypothetical protein GCM10009037_06900 [Halarchaeum grantii]|uniref:Uncharacterized protein n=1 Tax=Halarchaeum grantii TaxID=1193105 RepID=A0A830EZQ5_9EURY|nr:hypothetical protein [Halarchaeum grantii]GGL25894.1 hypothetical protein GCM10009037_06900 [Halarchaeum grantii]